MVACIVPCLRCVRAFKKLYVVESKVGEEKVDWCINKKEVFVNRKSWEKESWKRKKMVWIANKNKIEVVLMHQRKRKQEGEGFGLCMNVRM